MEILYPIGAKYIQQVGFLDPLESNLTGTWETINNKDIFPLDHPEATVWQRIA